MSDLGFDLIDGALTPRPGTCPCPLSADYSEEWCVANDHCGCGARERLEAVARELRKGER